jgi:hypothetical protein
MNDDIKYLVGYTGITEKIQRTIKDIGNNFCYIGLLLIECKNNEWYKEGNYASVVEYAEKELGFKKSTTYNFMSVCDKFSKRKNDLPTDTIEDKYNCFTFQKLVQMSSIKNLALLEEIKPEDTVKEIKKLKNSTRMENKKQEDKEEGEQINILDAEYTEINEKEDENLNIIIDLNEKLNKAYEKIQELENNIQTDKLLNYLKERLKLIKKLIKDEKKNENPNKSNLVEYSGSVNEIELFISDIRNGLE